MKLAEYRLFINFEKCQFAMISVNFLVYNFSDKGILPTVHNFKEILDLSMPRGKGHLRSFLGICNFYKKFVRGYSNLVPPLNFFTKTRNSFGVKNVMKSLNCLREKKCKNHMC